MHTLSRLLQNPSNHLAILRLFIALGWLRAGLDKFLSPDWSSGEPLERFLTDQAAQGLVVFPFYRQLIDHVFLNHTLLLSAFISVGQLAVGIALTLGLFTPFALIAGLFMNINFMLAGAVNPSAFYIIIQAILLYSRAGQILGLDLWLAKHIAIPWLVSQAKTAGSQMVSLSAALISMLFAFYCFKFRKPFVFHASIEDSALMLALLLVLIAALFVLKSFSFKPLSMPVSLLKSRHKSEIRT